MLINFVNINEKTVENASATKEERKLDILERPTMILHFNSYKKKTHEIFLPCVGTPPT